MSIVDGNYQLMFNYPNRGGAMKYFRLCVLGSGLLFVLSMHGNATAEMYKWVDKFGITHIDGSPPVDTPNKGKLKKPRANDISPKVRHPGATTTGDNPETVSGATKEPTVEIYVTSWCPASRKALEYFKNKGISFTAYDVEKDPDARRRQKEIYPRGSVPTVVINGNVFVGYNAEEFDRMLKVSR